MTELKGFPLKAANRCHTFKAFVYTKMMLDFSFLSPKIFHCTTPWRLEGDKKLPKQVFEVQLDGYWNL